LGLINTETTEKSSPKNILFTVSILLIILGLAIGYLRSADHLAALGQIKGWFVVPFVFGWLVYWESKRVDWRRLLAPLYWSMIVVSVWAILQKMGLISTLFYQTGDAGFSNYLTAGSIRAFGPFESPNYLAMFLVPVLFAISPLYQSAKNSSAKTILVLSLLLPVLAIFFADSRAGLLALAIGLVVLASSQFKTLKRLKFFIIIIAVAATAIIITLTGNHAGSDHARLQIYHYAWQLLQHNWFSGIGLADFQNQVASLAKAAGDQGFIQYLLPYALHPQNLYLAWWLNLGLPGLVGFVMLVVVWLKKIIKHLSNYQTAAIFTAMIAILVHGLFDTTYFKNDLAAIFWLIFFLGLAIANNP
jgi:O-antigen ligase